MVLKQFLLNRAVWGTMCFSLKFPQSYLSHPPYQRQTCPPSLDDLVAKLCLIFRDPDYSLPASFVHGILQARILEWVAISPSRGSSRPRDQTRVSCIAGEFFTDLATREAHPLPLKSFKTMTSKLSIVLPIHSLSCL